jgi:hypothetical protein
MYQLNAKDINDLYTCFCKIDLENIGYVRIENLLDFLEETEFSIIYPYLKGIIIYFFLFL